MKLLFDENLSRKLPARLSDLHPGSIHVSQADLLQTPDIFVFDYALRHGFVIVTTDSDFFDISISKGPPPKIIWLRRWKHPTRDAEQVLRREAVRITDFVENRELGILVLDK